MTESSHPYGFTTTAEEVTEGLDLTGTTWLVTGCNSGLGYETIRILALRGAHVIGAARTKEKAQKALDDLGIEGTAVACELSDLDSVRQCVKTVSEGPRALNGIIANAGIMALPALQQKNGIELQFYTNHIGHFVLVTGLVDKLTEDGRAVILSSGAHFQASPTGIEFDNLAGENDYHPWRMYGQSKLANILFAKSLAKRFREAGSKRTANAVHPGVIKTNLTRHLPANFFDTVDFKLKTLGQGAATQCYVATHPSLATVSGEYFANCDVADTSEAATDAAMAEKLWTVTEEIVAS